VIATLRLAVPYTGLILTARENAELRRELMSFGVSQIDAGSRIEIGGYTEDGESQITDREQFELGDTRSLDKVMRELLHDGYLPSFCTACYRLGRTGEHFMEFAIPGFIKRYCTPNALTTLTEYLADYASDETRKAGEDLIGKPRTGICIFKRSRVCALACKREKGGCNPFEQSMIYWEHARYLRTGCMVSIRSELWRTFPLHFAP
jgi:2-iminoacetate synthase